MPSAIIGDKEYASCNKVLQDAAFLKEDLKKCKDCGMDIGDREERLDSYVEFATAVKQNFFPNRK